MISFRLVQYAAAYPCPSTGPCVVLRSFSMLDLGSGCVRMTYNSCPQRPITTAHDKVSKPAPPSPTLTSPHPDSRPSGVMVLISPYHAADTVAHTRPRLPSPTLKTRPSGPLMVLSVRLWRASKGM